MPEKICCEDCKYLDYQCVDGKCKTCCTCINTQVAVSNALSSWTVCADCRAVNKNNDCKYFVKKPKLFIQKSDRPRLTDILNWVACLAVLCYALFMWRW